MQPMKFLVDWLTKNANSEHYLFTLQDLRSLFPGLSDSAYKTLLSRTVGAGYLEKVCRNLYMYSRNMSPTGLVLFHVAAHLRAHEFNYISLETVLSDAGVISQVPINSIFIMSSGRSNIIDCGKYGQIEFVHTSQKPNKLIKQIFYDAPCRLWRATVPQALRDMKITRRNNDLIDWDAANEFI
jgi:predicted transcriptional regulator of viral defense system